MWRVGEKETKTISLNKFSLFMLLGRLESYKIGFTIHKPSSDNQGAAKLSLHLPLAVSLLHSVAHLTT